jgi:hypothetical protein
MRFWLNTLAETRVQCESEMHNRRARHTTMAAYLIASAYYLPGGRSFHVVSLLPATRAQIPPSR